MFGDPQYAVKRLEAGTYLVAKFEDSTYPTDVYRVVDRGRSAWKCSCPSHFRTGDSDKHVRLVRRFQREGEPAGFYADGPEGGFTRLEVQ